MGKHTYFIENTPINRVINSAYDSIGEEGYLSLFTSNYALLNDMDKLEVIGIITEEYKIGIIDFIYECLNEYSKLHTTVSKELKKARRNHLNDPNDQLALIRFKTWVEAKERLGLQKRLLIKCIIDNSALLSQDIDEEINNFY